MKTGICQGDFLQKINRKKRFCLIFAFLRIILRQQSLIHYNNRSAKRDCFSMIKDGKSGLSVRNAAILQILCDEYKMMPENGAVPSLRKIKTRFNIGSATAELIQKKLCDHFSIPHSQRKKIRKPVSQTKQTGNSSPLDL